MVILPMVFVSRYYYNNLWDRMGSKLKIKTAHWAVMLFLRRANGGIRTLDLALTKRLLYQLSYVGVHTIIPVRVKNAQDYLWRMQL